MKVQPCTRWVVVYSHDSQPVEGWMYVHKVKAEQQIMKCKNPTKYRVEQISVLDTAMMNTILDRLSELEKVHHAG
jgi:hypothetical protein